MDALIADLLRHPNLQLPELADPAGVAQSLSRFLRLWEKWNPKIQLTSEKDAVEVLRQHVFDSLQYARAMTPSEKTLDIGSGGGFPAIPLKILFPGLPLTLLESQRKKTGFLHAVGAELRFQDFQVVNARAEEAAADPALAGSFDCVTYRAVGSTVQCLAWARPFLKPGGRVVVKKGLEEGEAEVPANDPFVLDRAIPIFGHDGKESRLLVFRLQA
ncbi:16S rRNA (guanine(527)-N(7))-methyltransferase RsmG [Nitrospina gracilis]|uniref:16S rRNA (guanine(527)-N(7))-methyltransferase RsmG n=1 Tax=Nitrospina gracilis TaxID=35801 RepID=UPI001F00148F|nr:16S rRNA (guanine527-N7)-methyltransferase [Nitrospina gracilis Nb-211]